MSEAAIVSPADWRAARLRLLEREKEFTRLRDELSRERRALPRVRIEKNYRFQTEDGEKSLADLFYGAGQLIIYHFMYGPDWEEGCKSCSFWADNFEGIGQHLRQRDTRLVAVSRAPLETLLAFRKRMGWTFPWASSAGSDFNFDFNVSFEDGAAGEYNYVPKGSGMDELPGVSVFLKDEDGAVFHTYSTFARGLDMLNGAYHFLDLTPKGRDEDDLDFSMAWVKLHDQY